MNLDALAVVSPEVDRSRAPISNRWVKGFTTPEKVARDGEFLRRHARYVIIIDEQGDLVGEPIDRSKKHSFDCIAVLAPVVHRGVKIKRAVVLEIGLGRFVPYQECSRVINGSAYYNNRKQAAQLSPKVMLKLLPHLSKALHDVCLERVLGWKTAEFFVAKINHNTPRGIFATIHTDETLLCYVVYEADLWARKYLRKGAHMVRKTIGKMQRYKRQENQERVAKQLAGIMWDMRHRSRRHFDYFCSLISHSDIVALENCVLEHGKKYWGNRLKTESTLQEMVCPREYPEWYRKALQIPGLPSQLEILKLWPIRSMVHKARDKRRVRHARGCLRFEVSVPQQEVSDRRTPDAPDGDFDNDIPF